MSDEEAEGAISARPPAAPAKAPATVQLRYQASALPPAGQMETYERLMPGATDRLFRILEEDAASRHLQSRDSARFMLRGQVLSFLVIVGVLAVAAFIAHAGAPTAAATLVGVTVGGGALLTLFARHRAEPRAKR